MALGLRGRNRKKKRGDGPGTAGRVVGNVLLLLATLAVGALAAYLVLYPPGVVTKASAQPIVAPSAPATASGTAATTAKTLEQSCAESLPLLDQTTLLGNTDLAKVDKAAVATLATSLTGARDSAPAQLPAVLDPLVTLVSDFNTSLADGSATEPLNGAAVSGLAVAIRDQCP